MWIFALVNMVGDPAAFACCPTARADDVYGTFEIWEWVSDWRVPVSLGPLQVGGRFRIWQYHGYVQLQVRLSLARIFKISPSFMIFTIFRVALEPKCNKGSCVFSFSPPPLRPCLFFHPLTLLRLFAFVPLK